MKVHVDGDSCAGHGVCAALCPEVFVITDDGWAKAVQLEVPPALVESVVEAAASCPEHAVHISEEVN